MTSSASQRVIAVLCLVAFCLGQTVFGAFRVKCEDGSGQARFEAACIRTVDGSCATRCGSDAAADEVAGCDEDGEHAPHPCKDTPVGESLKAARVHSQAEYVDLAQLAVVVAVLAEPLAFGEPARLTCVLKPPMLDRPPDLVERIRTVILVV